MSRRYSNPAVRTRGKNLTLCACGTPTRDGAFICSVCLDGMTGDLRELLPSGDDDPGLWATLESVIAGERGIDYRIFGGGSGGSVATGIVSNEAAVKRAAQLRQTLHRLVVLNARKIDHLVGRIEVQGSVQEMARWLIWRLDRMALHPEFATALRKVEAAVDHARSSVMPLPARQWLGACGAPDCDGSMFARPDETLAVCPRCGAWVEAKARRNWLISELENELYTAAEIAALCEPDPRVRPAVRKRLNQWASRGRLLDPRVIDWTPGQCPYPSPTGLRFRFGDAFGLLVAHEDETTTSTPARSNA